MKTVEQGDRFEEKVFRAIEAELKGDRLGLSPSSAKIFHKKAYHSKDRGSDIIVDVSIEIWLPAATNYSQLWICECKDYGRPVPVDDIEEFKAKLGQIAGKNVKGVLATSNSLQSGALSYARSKGIGVVRVLPDSQVEWLIHLVTNHMRDGKSGADYIAALTHEGYISKNQEVYGVYDEYCMDCWFRILQKSLKDG